MAVIIVAIIPIILGMVWPDGTETVDVWNVEPGIDVTGDLSNRDLQIWETYAGPINNMTVINPNSQYGELTFPIPVAQTDIPNAYPVTLLESVETESSILIGDIGTTDKARYGIWANAGFSVTGESATYKYADYWPGTNTMFLYDMALNPVKAITPQYTDQITGSLSVATFRAPFAYVDIAKGSEAYGQWYWIGGMENKSVDIWVKINKAYNGSYFEADDIRVLWNGSNVAVSDYSDPDNVVTTALGSIYEYVSIRLSAGTAEIVGLIGVESFVDNDYTEGNRISLNYGGPLNNIPMHGAYSSWWVKSTVSAVGTTKGINNSSLKPSDYFGVNAWQVQIINPSVFGDSLVFAKGSTVNTYPIESGAITVTNLVNGETSSQPVRGMRVLSLIEGGAQNVYINGIKAIQYPASGGVTVTFSGPWMASIVTAKVVQSQQERYTWDTASFGFDQTSFCTVGMLSCAMVAIIGSFWGKRTGESIAALYLVMGVCAAAYIIMIP